MAARASSIESWEPFWIWRFKNFSVNLRRDDLYGGPCTTQGISLYMHGEQEQHDSDIWGTVKPLHAHHDRKTTRQCHSTSQMNPYSAAHEYEGGLALGCGYRKAVSMTFLWMSFKAFRSLCRAWPTSSASAGMRSMIRPRTSSRRVVTGASIRGVMPENCVL